MKEGKTFKRVLAIALVVVMAMTMVPFGAFATAEDACVHENARVAANLHPAVPASCSEFGMKAYYLCPDCNQKIVYYSNVAKVETDESLRVDKLAHAWTAATCTAPKTCSVCNETEGTATDHTWTGGTCTTAKTCSACGATGEVAGHSWTNATCVAPKTCSVCGETEGSALTHSFTNYTSNNNATCTLDGTKTAKCDNCEAKDTQVDIGSALGHDWNAATCTAPKSCKRCDATEGANAEHDWNAATCTAAKTCKDCGKVEGNALGHDPEATPTKIDAAKHGKRCKRTGCGEFVDQANHNYATIRTVPATCKAAGEEVKKCDGCGDEITSAIPQNNDAHAWGAWTIEAHASCSAEGLKKRVCANDPTHVETEAIEKTAHSGGKTEAKAATCKAKGNIEYWTCTKCLKKFSDAEFKNEVTDVTTAQLEHVFTTYTVTTDATCTAHAKETATCNLCNEGTHTRDIPGSMIAHNFKDYVSNNDATCIADGTMTATCDMCKTETKTIADVGSKDKAPHTPNEAGTLCKLCGKELTCLHTYSGEKLITVTPTCTTDGEKANICSKCNEKKPGSAEKIAALGHNWDVGTVTTEPTCEKKGVKTFKCTNAACTETKTEDVAIVEHDYDKEIVQPTCEEDGYTTFTCKMCKSSYIGDKTDKYGHSYVTYVADEGSATCYADGTKTAECDHGCGKKNTVADEGSKIDHKLTDFAQTKAPDCVNEGEEEAKCFYYDKCGYSELVPIDALGHDEPAEFTVVTPATCTEKGLQTKTCTRCPEVVKSEEIAALGHTITEATAYTVDKAPSCLEKGSESKHCERCTYTEGAREIDALGHDYQPGAGTEATCEKGGKAHYTCTRCADAYTVDDGPALGHEYVYVSNNDATCTEDGTKTGKCIRCEDVKTITDEGTMLTHVLGEAVVTPATEEADGSRVKTCTLCGEYKESEKISKIASITLKYTTAVYNGEAKRPLLTITDAAGNVLIKDTDYEVVLPTKAESAEIGTHSYKVTFIGNYEGEEELTYQVVPGKPNKIISKGTKQSYISLKWSNVKGADGYRVYVKNANGKWKTLATVTGTNVYKADKLEAGKKYEFAVKAFAKTDEGTIWAKEFTEMSFTTLPTKTSKVTYTAKKTIAKLTWKEVKNADGYRIYVYDSKTEKYKTVATVKNGKTTYTVTELKAGTTYKFAVKAYVKDGDTTIWSNQYTAVKVTTKK